MSDTKAKPIPVPSTTLKTYTTQNLDSSEESLAGRFGEVLGVGNVRILSTSLADREKQLFPQVLQTVPATTTNTTSNTPHNSTQVQQAPNIAPIAAILHDDPKRKKTEAKSQLLVRTEASKQITMFAHLQQYERVTTATLSERVKELVHPSVVRLGLKFVNLPLMGAVERVRSMLRAFQQVIQDYVPPPDQVISRHLDAHLKPLINYLVQARPLAVSQSNAIRHLKLTISRIDPDKPIEQARQDLITLIDEYIDKRVDGARIEIARLVDEKIRDGDVILTYARASATCDSFLRMAESGKRFRVIVVDSKPHFEGKDSLLPQLRAAGIDCSYIHINAIGYIMKEVTKIIVGAYCIFSNGTLMSRTGTSIICQQGRLSNVPVMVVCETMKFSERVQLDSFVFNELGDPDELAKDHRHDNNLTHEQLDLLGEPTTYAPNTTYRPLATHPWITPIKNWRSIPNLNLLNILYDVTPPEFITVVICEVGLIPATSIPVVLREYNIAANN